MKKFLSKIIVFSLIGLLCNFFCGAQKNKGLHSVRKKRVITPPILGVNVTAANLGMINVIPPATMGSVGPTQFIVAIDGLVKSLDKNTGLADGGIDVDLDTFFDSVRGGQPCGYPRIRYDRLSGRWFLLVVTLPSSGSNKILVAVSDTEDISDMTVWTFFVINSGTGIFYDFPTLGIDVNALYVGGRTVKSGSPNASKVFVIRKSSLLGGGPIYVTEFNNLITSAGEGMYIPQGVDNLDDSPLYGYFIGSDNKKRGTFLVLRRVTDPGGVPTISGDIRISIPATKPPLRVPHLGNNKLFAGRLDSLDDRLSMAIIRDGELWTVHNIGVDNKGKIKSTITRTASRWYQIEGIEDSPSLLNVGTLFHKTLLNNGSARFYWMPSISVSGQGSMALGCSTAGAKNYINAVVARRFKNDGYGLLSSPTFMTSSTTKYNPPSNSGSLKHPRKWGPYSFTSIDPCDDMTFWTIQEYCNATNLWGVKVAQIIASQPAAISSLNPSSIPVGQTDVAVQINGVTANGSGFFNPDVLTLCQLSVDISGGVSVSEIEVLSPTLISFKVSTVGALVGPQDVTVTNPDGQSVTLSGGLTVT